MSNELTTTGPGYLAEYQEDINNQIDQQSKLIKNPLELYPQLKMEKSRMGFVIQMGDQTISTFETVYFVCLGPEVFLGSRALFPPGKDATMPVCATRLQNPNTKWYGKWMSELFDSPSGTDAVDCERCPWAKFGSQARWMGDEDRKGSACNERRMVFGFVAEEVGVNEFKILNRTIVTLVTPVTSLKVVDQMPLQATAQKLPLSAAVFHLANEVKTSGQYKWTVLKSALKGYIQSKEDYDYIRSEAKKLEDLVRKTSDPVTGSYNETQVENMTQEEIDQII